MPMNNMTGEQSKLLHKINSLSFALVETNLYLDGHPTNRAALDYYRTTYDEYKRLKEEYESKYAPLTPTVGASDTEWKWVREPWPWEVGFPETGAAIATKPLYGDD
jgi:spore coat protein JB